MSPQECAIQLRQFNAWRRGDDETIAMPSPREIGEQIDYACQILDAMSEHDHLMIIAATRYCLGRMTYVVGNCANWLIKLWPILPEHTRIIIQRDIEEAFARDDTYRLNGIDYKALGNDCDREDWTRVRALWGAA